MIRLLIWLLLGYIGYRVLKSLVAPGRPSAVPERTEGEETVQDPVCNCYLARQDAVVGVLDGKRYYFCSHACLETFRKQLDQTSHS